jgi:chromosome segregation ATPase
MDRSKEEILGSIQNLNTRRKQQSADLKSQQDSLKEIDDELPAKKELIECIEKAAGIRERLKEQRKNSEAWRNQREIVAEAQTDLDTTDEALSDTLIQYMIVTKSKSVHAVPEDPEAVDREIVTTARVGAKVSANLSLFDADGNIADGADPSLDETPTNEDQKE